MTSALQRRSRAVLALGSITLCAGCSGSTATTTSTSTGSTGQQGAVTVAVQRDSVAIAHPSLPAYSIRLFAAGTGDHSNPDSVAVDGSKVFVGYQNVTAKDGSDHKTSTIVQYSMDGKAVKQWPVPGHNDGLRVDPSTHLVWATSNEDGNPRLVTIDTSSDKITPYTFPSPPHGGGYDDVYFLNGTAFIAASNPTLDSSGNNPAPAVDRIVLGDGTVQLTPVLMGNAMATDTISGKQVQLVESDPDSFTTDGQGDLVLIDQGASEYITISHPGTPQQSVTRTPIGNQVDDTVWISGKGRVLVTDGTTNGVFVVSYQNVFPGILTEAPDDSGVVGFLGIINPATGFVSPVMIGFLKPTGMTPLPG